MTSLLRWLVDKVLLRSVKPRPGCQTYRSLEHPNDFGEDWLEPQTCTVKHDEPSACNGWPRTECPQLRRVSFRPRGRTVEEITTAACSDEDCCGVPALQEE